MPKGKKKKKKNVPPGEGYLGVLSIGRACPYPAPQKMGAQDGGSWASGLLRELELRGSVARRKLRLESFQVQGSQAVTDRAGLEPGFEGFQTAVCFMMLQLWARNSPPGALA